jgi:uncharacterized cupredoxin-like copper-binding protein
MHRKGSISAVFGVFGLGLTVWLLTAAIGPASGAVGAHKAAKVTIVNVTAGKPSELAFKLSKFSNLPTGTIIFKVTNAGFAFHDFKICTTPTASSAAISCAGKVTKLLKHGQSATLTVVMTKTGKYLYLCTVSGHAASGMKGLIGVGVKVAATSTSASTSGSGTTGSGTTTTTTATTTTTSTGGGGGGGGTTAECPAGTTIQSAAAGGGDHDDDDTGAPSDFDGCI